MRNHNLPSNMQIDPGVNEPCVHSHHVCIVHGEIFLAATNMGSMYYFTTGNPFPKFTQTIVGA